MKTKFLLPMLAMIVAIGMSFASPKTNDPTTDYIWVDNSYEPIHMEITECGTGDLGCQIQFGDGPVYDLYDSPGVLKVGNGTLVRR